MCFSHHNNDLFYDFFHHKKWQRRREGVPYGIEPIEAKWYSEINFFFQENWYDASEMFTLIN